MASMYSDCLCRRSTVWRVPAVIFLWLIVFCTLPLPGQQIAAPRQAGSSLSLTADQVRILARAHEILTKTTLTEAEQTVRLCILEAALAGNVITPDDDNPEARNPRHWTLSNGTFVVAPKSTAVEAIADLWTVHENDGVPIPRIWCYKYSSLTIVQGYIRYFRDAGNTAGLAALNKLIGHNAFPAGLPNEGEGLLWKRRCGSDNLLPGDQVWVENPHFDRGRELIHREAYQQAISDGKSPKEAADAADATTESYAVGEEGSNIFFGGDQTLIRGAISVTRPFRNPSQRPEKGPAAHEQVVQRRVFGMKRYQQHMIDDNYTVQAFMRANPGAVRPEDFRIMRVRSPLDPENLLRLTASADPNESLEVLIDAMASRNKPPRLIAVGDATIPLFGDDYDWSEQQRVRGRWRPC